MPGIIKRLTNLFTYKEPKDVEGGYELLESKYEKKQNNTSQQKKVQTTANQDNTNVSGNQEANKQKSKKTPMAVEEWNESRKNTDTGDDTNLATGQVSQNLSNNLEVIKQRFSVPKNNDIIIREFKIARKLKAFLVFVNGMIDKQTLNRDLLPQLMSKDNFDELGEQCPADYIMESVLSVNQISKEKKINEIIKEVLTGKTALFIEGCTECLLMETIGFEKRSVEQPVTESVVMGAHEGFNENLKTNLTLMRRGVKNEKLMIEIIRIPNANNKCCAVLYLDGAASPEVVREVKRRIKSIDTDFVMGIGMLEQLIEDNPFALFPQMLTTERPDRAASFIMDGKVVIFADGTPFALIVPISFLHLIHTSEDSALRWQYGTALRFVRIIGILLATFLPGLYIALTLFHQEMIPTELLSSIAKSKEEVPFPAVIEILMLEIAFELIREGGIRVPGIIGQTLGIIGALILGEAAVAAGLVSPILIIVVSVTGIGSFAIPNYSLSIGLRIIRFIFTILGATAGFYGLSAGIVILGSWACGMKSFGAPYFSPIAPKTKRGTDIIIKHPIWKQEMRADFINSQNVRRQPHISRGWTKQKGGDDK